MHKSLENSNRSYNSIAKELQLKKKVQEPYAECLTTVLFLKTSVSLTTMKLKYDHQKIYGPGY